MGGEGSGRHADPVKVLQEQRTAIATHGNEGIYLPNLSGVQSAVLKSPAAGTLTINSKSNTEGVKITGNVNYNVILNRIGLRIEKKTDTTKFIDIQSATPTSTNTLTLPDKNANLIADDNAGSLVMTGSITGTGLISTAGLDITGDSFFAGGDLNINSGNLVFVDSSSFINLLVLDGTNPTFKLKGTNETPLTTWTGGVPSANPKGFIKIEDEGQTTQYIPFWS